VKVARTDWQANPKPLADGRMAIAIGDVHGHAEHLDLMYRELARDVSRLGPSETTCILLGDLIDRGADSLDCLGLAVDGLNAHARGREIEDIVLMGNHDAWLDMALRDTLSDADLRVWMRNGGEQTFESLGVPATQWGDALSAAIRARLPRPEVELVASMKGHHRIGDLFFVHAGLDPRLAMEDQDESTFLWIREPFLDAADWPFEVLVVHGHTIEKHDGAPAVHPHRICIDSGAYVTGMLTAVEFLGDRMRFLTVTDSRAGRWT